ncbi:MAG: MotA/TolQ/ExbB proton channel family protein [Saprospiraceae bacterium]|nr:MotA/TolQ/ExbB proton channel family protein [Saprospiraceae bacterium]
MNNNKIFQLVISIGGALVFWFMLMMLAEAFDSGSSMHRFFEMFGGSKNGYIQMLTYAAFIYGLLQLTEKQRIMSKEKEGFKLNLLPEQDQLVLSPEEVANIKLNVLQLEQRGFKFIVADFIKKACTQYRNDQSIGETLQVLEAQINNHKEDAEGQLEIVKYIIQAISSLGFIGTVLGLSASIGLAHLAKTEEGMPTITNNLNIAFDTTLVALLLGLILTFFYHRHLADLDSLYSRTKMYIIDNLVSRIYKG